LNCGRKSKYICPGRFEVLHLDIVEDILEECQKMEAIVRQGTKCSLVFGFGWSDRYENKNDKVQA
jgi:hypothetical protein